MGLGAEAAAKRAAELAQIAPLAERIQARQGTTTSVAQFSQFDDEIQFANLLAVFLVDPVRDVDTPGP